MYASLLLALFGSVIVATCLPSAASEARSVDVVPPTCGNLGFQWAAYPDYEGYENDDDFDPNDIQSESPELGPSVHRGYHHYYAPGGDAKVWRSRKETDTSFMILNEIGYLYAPLSGNYTFNVTEYDDAVFIWLGDNAYSGWNRSNADLYVDLDSAQPTTFASNLTAGQYYPYRMIYLNKEGTGAFDIFITGPTNKEVPTRNFVQHSCDGTTAPPFPDYNSTRKST